MQISRELVTWIDMLALANGLRTRASIAQACGCSEAYISLILNGRRPVPGWLVDKLEDVLDLKRGTIRRRYEQVA